MSIVRFIRGTCLVFFGLWVPVGIAQVTVDLSIDQEQFLRDESLMVEVRIINRSGQDIHFEQGDWLTFFIERKDGPYVQRKQSPPAQEAFTLESSLVATRRMDLMPYFVLDEPGRYSVTAHLKINQWHQELGSKPATFDITRGTTIWSQDFGLPAESGIPEVRKYALVQANNFKQLILYLRLSDQADQKVFRMLSLGQLVSFSRPETQLDRKSNLHALFQTGARTFLYYAISPQGTVLNYETYDYTTTRPVLKNDFEGKIYVAGGRRRLTPNDIPPSREPLPSVNPETAKP